MFIKYGLLVSLDLVNASRKKLWQLKSAGLVSQSQNPQTCNDTSSLKDFKENEDMKTFENVTLSTLRFNIMYIGKTVWFSFQDLQNNCISFACVCVCLIDPR